MHQTYGNNEKNGTYGVKAQRGDNGGEGLPNFAFSKGDIRKALGKGKERGIGGRGNKAIMV